MPSTRSQHALVLSASLLLLSFLLSACTGGKNGGGGGGVNNIIDLNVDAFISGTSSGPNITFTDGTNASLDVVVTNIGKLPSDQLVTVTVGLPTGVTFVSYTSRTPGWTCNASGQTITCTSSAPIAGLTGSSTITIMVSVASNASGTPRLTLSILTPDGSPSTSSGSKGVIFNAAATPSITSLIPNAGAVGTSVTIAGSNFGSTQGSSTVKFNGTTATPTSWSATSIVAPVPTGATTGNVVVTVGGVASNGVLFTVTAGGAPSITSLNRTLGPVGTSVTITGTNFGATEGTSTVTFNGTAAAPTSWSATSINVAVPAGATTGNVVVTVGGVLSNGVTFTVLGACPLPTLGSESLLNGTYTALFNGWADSPVSVTEATAAFKANGTTALITSGEVDAGAVAIGVAQGAPVNTTFTGCFNLGADDRGLMIWNSALGQSLTFAFAIRADGSQGRFIEFDDANPSTTPGSRGAGFFEKQVLVTATNAPVAFSLTGWSPNGSNSEYRRSGSIGVVSNIVFGGGMSNGTNDIAATNDGTGTQLNIDNVTFTATFSAPDTLGRGTAILTFANVAGICGTPPCPLTLNFAYYEGGIFNSPGHLFLQSTDIPDNVGHSLDNGEAIPQTPGITFGPGALFPNAIVQMTGADLSSNHAYTDIAAGRIHSDGSGATTVNLDEVSNGSQVNVGTTAITGGAFAVSANGMGSISFGPSRFFSVAMIGNNAGFILEGTQANVPSPGHILVGDFGPQAPYGQTGGLNSTIFSGLYAIGDDYPASTSSDNFVGSITANPSAVPSPSFSGKTDSSSGAGCISNCLKANQAVAATYSVDAIGRTTVTFTSGGSGTPVGWALTNTDLDLLSDTTAGTMNGTILKLIQ